MTLELTAQCGSLYPQELYLNLPSTHYYLILDHQDDGDENNHSFYVKVLDLSAYASLGLIIPNGYSPNIRRHLGKVAYRNVFRFNQAVTVYSKKNFCTCGSSS
jgi:hypothetical protein